MGDFFFGFIVLYLIIGIVKTFTKEVCNHDGTPGNLCDYIICIILWPFIGDDV